MSVLHFVYPQKVLFKHCDPAGIVFYPRFFEMINDAIEAMFSDLLDWPFEVIMERHGVPTAAISVGFKSPCRHGDMLKLNVTITDVGRSSMTLKTRAMRDETLCFEAEQTLVCIERDGGRPISWPTHVKENIEKVLEANA